MFKENSFRAKRNPQLDKRFPKKDHRSERPIDQKYLLDSTKLFPYVANVDLETFGNKTPAACVPLVHRSGRCSPHILFVGDDAEISRLVSRYLRANDFHVSVIPDG